MENYGDLPKVLFITRKWPPAIGGMETYSFELTKALKNEALELKVLALPGKVDGSPPGLLALFIFVFKSLFFIVTHSNQYDVVHIGDFVLAPLGFIARVTSRKSKVFIMIHGLDILFGNRKGLLPAVYRVYQYLITKLKPAHHYVANSSNTGELCSSHALEPFTVIPLGVRTDLPALDNVTPSNDILFLGRLVTRKGAAWFSQNVLPHLDEKYRFIVIGKTWDKSEEDILRINPRVVLKGYVDDAELSVLKQTCLLAVMPNQPSESATDVEGFGLVAAELSVQGVPLIATNIEGLTSAVINKETGFLIEHDSIETWVKQINDIALWSTEKRTEFALNCRNVAMSYYSWERVGKDTVKHYRSGIK
jgi:glycosyltransferase involved in cell wall biosynthesis